MATSDKVFRFERNELDLRRYELRRGGKRLPLSRKLMDLLILLVEERGRLLSRDEIAQHLWEDPAAVDVEQGINAAVKRIRAVLNDDAAKPRFVETVVGKGYRFIASVDEIGWIGQTAGTALRPEQPAAPAPLPLSYRDSLAVEERAVPAIKPALAQEAPHYRLAREWVAIALLLVAGLGTWYAARLWAHHRLEQQEELTFQQVTSLIPENRATAGAISPDGSLTAYANSDGIFLQARDGQTSRLHAPKDFTVDELAWFSSGTKLVASGFSLETGVPAVWTIFVTGETPRLLHTHARRAVPSPDGIRIAFISQDRSAIWTMGSNGEDARQVLAGPGDDTFPLVFWPPGGRRLSFQRRHYAPERDTPNIPSAETRWDVYYERSYECLDLSTGRITAHVPNVWIESAAALPDGRLRFLRWYPAASLSVQLWEVRTNLTTGAFLDEPRKLADLPENNERMFMTGMTTSQDGRETLVLRQSNQYAVFVGNFDSHPPRVSDTHRLTLDDRSDFPHAWTRDSQSVIFESNRYGNFDIFKQGIDQRTAEPVVATPLPEVMPQVGPDGHWVLYRTWAPGERYSNSKLMRVPIDGGTPEQVPIAMPLGEFRCALEYGKRCVLRNTQANQYYSFWDLQPVQGRGRELTRTPWLPGVLGDWDISPDGTQVALPNHSSRDARIRLVELEPRPGKTREYEVMVPGLSNLSSVNFTANGDGWFASVETPAGNRLYYVSREGVSQPLGDIAGWVSPAPDGHRIAFLNQIVAANAWLIHRP